MFYPQPFVAKTVIWYNENWFLTKNDFPEETLCAATLQR